MAFWANGQKTPLAIHVGCTEDQLVVCIWFPDSRNVPTGKNGDAAEAKGGGEANVSLDGYRFRDTSRSFRAGNVVYSNETIAGLRVGHLHPVIIKSNFVKVEE